jgi:hypothetical protein
MNETSPRAPVERIVGGSLPWAPCTVDTAEQCRALGIAVGDTIQGREEGTHGYWNEARLTLLWLGEEVAVWRATKRSSANPAWSEPEESAGWTLDCRQWSLVPPNAHSATD